jgi:phosphate/sulfate permease
MASLWCSQCCLLQLSGTSVPGISACLHPVLTLIGAIIGIGLTNALMTGTSVVDALNIPKVLGILAL